MSGDDSELQEVQEKLQTLNNEWTVKFAAQEEEFQREKYVSI